MTEMYMKEKLEVIAHLGDHITYKENIGICYDSAIAKVIENAYMALKNGVTVQEWISVKDRLPTEEDATNGGFVFAYNTNNKVIIATYQDVVRFSDFVKYWTHLPQQPKGELQCE